MILKGILDVEVSERVTSEVELLTSCGGAPETALSGITPGRARLVGGRVSVQANLIQLDASECITNEVTVGRNIGDRLKLKNDRRYTVAFDTVSRVMSFSEKPITAAFIPIRIGNQVIENEDGEQFRIPLTDNQIFISAPGVVQLGIIGDDLLLRHGLRQKALDIRRGSDIFEVPFLQVTPNTAEATGLTSGNTFVSFHQDTSLLRINPGK